MTAHSDTPFSPPKKTADGWDVFAYTLGELTPAAMICFEERMAHDPQLREEFLSALKLLNALHFTPATTALPTPVLSTPHRPLSSQIPSFPPGTAQRRRSYTATFAASTALVAILLAACSIQSSQTPSADSLRDAVTLSSMLQHTGAALEIPADPYTPPVTPAIQLDTPDWLLTAIDLDEQLAPPDTPPGNDQDAIF